MCFSNLSCCIFILQYITVLACSMKLLACFSFFACISISTPKETSISMWIYTNRYKVLPTIMKFGSGGARSPSAWIWSSNHGHSPQEQCHTMHHCMLRTLLGLLCRQGEVNFKQQKWCLNKIPTMSYRMLWPHKWLFSRVYSLVALLKDLPGRWI